MAAMRALLLTDIVDSTRLADRLEDAELTALWTAHDRIARDLLVEWRGREIGKSDGMLALFDLVSDAVGYALAYHRALLTLSLPIKARTGIHVGPVNFRSNLASDVSRGAKPVEVDGIALPTVARVMSVALGGQTLMSADARLALGVTTWRLESCGHWVMQGITAPIELFEVVEDDGTFTTPPDADKAYRVVRTGDLWRPVRELRHTLPAERDSFVGRQSSLDTLDAKLSGSTRLISVLGVGGAGKTRLVIRFAWTRFARFVGGIWFCDLSQARDLDGVHFAVAQGLEIPPGTGDAGLLLGESIASRGRCLVVFDNFEQVATLAEETLGHWLDRAPLARFIVTTREVLGIVGEETFAIPPLVEDDAVELFNKRAKSAFQAFEPDLEDIDAIRKLVKVLDCLPLAIELAAARVRIMPPRVLLERMTDRFAVLLSRHGRKDRQATLRAAFDWSWELLAEAEKAALARLSVFEGGFTLDAAGAVLIPDAHGRDWQAVELVESLVDKSLVRQVSENRFDLLESVRDYAGQHLRTEGRFAHSGPSCEAEARALHWRHFATLDERAAVAHRCVELNNLIAACRAAVAAADVRASVGCLVAAWMALRLVGPYKAAVELVRAVERLPDLTSSEKGWIQWVAGGVLEMMGRIDESRLHIQQGLIWADEARDCECRARLLIVRGSRQTLDGDLELALANLTEAHDLAAALQQHSVQVNALNILGRLMNYQARFPEARDYYRQALALCRVIGDRRTEGGLLGNLGGLHHSLGELQPARELYEQALVLAIEGGDKRWEGNAHCNLGLIYQDQGERAAAKGQFEVALDIANGMGDVRLAYTVLCNLGILLSNEGRYVEAADRLRQAVAGAIASSDRRSEGQFCGYLALTLAKQGLLPDAREMLDRGDRLLVATSDRLSQALILCDRAEIESLAGRLELAVQALDRAKIIAQALECGPESEVGRRIAMLEASQEG